MSVLELISVIDGVEFVCPFCNAKGVASAQRGAVFHYEPRCQKFVELDPIDYLKAVNLAKANARGVGLA